MKQIIYFFRYIFSVSDKQIYSTSAKFYKLNCTKFLCPSIFRDFLYTFFNYQFCYYRYCYWLPYRHIFTWGSVFLIGIISHYFHKNISSRISGALLGALIFFIVTNFGVWLSGMYGMTIAGLILTYTMAIPFFAYSVISTLCFSVLIEICYKILRKKYNFKKPRFRQKFIVLILIL